MTKHLDVAPKSEQLFQFLGWEHRTAHIGTEEMARIYLILKKLQEYFSHCLSHSEDI
jgi:hypothetical protein